MRILRFIVALCMVATGFSLVTAQPAHAEITAAAAIQKFINQDYWREGYRVQVRDGNGNRYILDRGEAVTIYAYPRQIYIPTGCAVYTDGTRFGDAWFRTGYWKTTRWQVTRIDVSIVDCGNR